MSTVKFDEGEQPIMSRRILGEPSIPNLVTNMMKTGLVKSERGAFYVLFSIIVCLLVLSAIIVFFVLIRSGSKVKVYNPSNNNTVVNPAIIQNN